MLHDVSPTARALLAFVAIQNRPGLTGSELAAQLGVTDPAARRYVGILREAGMPIDSVSGRYGRLFHRTQRTAADTQFSTAEALGFVMALLRGWHGSTDTDDAAATPDPTLTAEIAHACEKHNRLQIGYRSRPDSYSALTHDWCSVGSRSIRTTR